MVQPAKEEREGNFYLTRQIPGEGLSLYYCCRTIEHPCFCLEPKKEIKRGINDAPSWNKTQTR
jgi:hypothetical protein